MDLTSNEVKINVNDPVTRTMDRLEQLWVKHKNQGTSPPTLREMKDLLFLNGGDESQLPLVLDAMKEMGMDVEQQRNPMGDFPPLEDEDLPEDYTPDEYGDFDSAWESDH